MPKSRVGKPRNWESPFEHHAAFEQAALSRVRLEQALCDLDISL